MPDSGSAVKRWRWWEAPLVLAVVAGVGAVALKLGGVL